MAEALLNKGADPAVRDARGGSAIDKAERNGLSAIVDLFRSWASVTSESGWYHFTRLRP